jgi:hypothetical protein
MNNRIDSLEQFAPETCRFYRHAIDLLHAAEIPFLVGGAYAFGYYTGIARHTKDFDVFLHRSHVRSALQAFEAAGYRSEIVFTHWLGKAYCGKDFVDLIYSSGNGACPVDETWFDHAGTGEVLGKSVRLMPAEEMIWQKAYIMERERFDGADVVHLLRARSGQLDWNRLIRRFGPHWRILLSHLILFGFIYPDERDKIPVEVLHNLMGRLHQDPAPRHVLPVCQGTLLSRTQYLDDTESWGYTDARLAPLGRMTEDQIATWTDAGRPNRHNGVVGYCPREKPATTNGTNGKHHPRHVFS